MASVDDVEGSENLENDNGLSDEQRLSLLRFQEITAIVDKERSREILESYHWNLEQSVNSILGGGIVDHDEFEDLQAGPSYSRPPTPRPGAYDAVVSNNLSWSEWLKGLVLFPIRFTYSTVTGVLTFIVRLLWPTFGKARTEPIEDVLSFKNYFEEKYGTTHPVFYQGSYLQATNDAKKELKFLLVYLHSSNHQDTPEFCRNVLANPGLTEYVNGNMLFWGCDVNSNEGNRVSRAMRETRYPYLSVLCLRENRMMIVWRLEGPIEVDKLISYLSRVIDANEPALVAARAERNERSFTKVLRQEQDEAYLESLKIDQEKERKRREAEEVEKREQQLKQSKLSAKEQKLNDIQRRRLECQKRLAELPEVDSSDPLVVQVRVRLPDGRQLYRQFKKTDELQLLYDYVFSHENVPNEFLLCSTFPRKTYAPDGRQLVTLEDVGLDSATSLLVQDITEDSSEDSD